MAAPPLDSTCDGPVTYPGDIKTLRIPSKGKSFFMYISNFLHYQRSIWKYTCL